MFKGRRNNWHFKQLTPTARDILGTEWSGQEQTLGRDGPTVDWERDTHKRVLRPEQPGPELDY